MGFFSLQIKEKVLFSLVVILLLFLAYSESLKNISVCVLIGFFIWDTLTGRIKITKDIINISIISHLTVVLIGIFLGININESLNQVMDVIYIVIIFLFFREANLSFISYEKILNLLFVGFAFAALYGMYLFFSTTMTRLELNSVGSVNRSSAYMMYIFVTALSLIRCYKSKFSKLIFPVVLFISFLSILIAASRMALFSLPVIIFLFGIFFKKNDLSKLSIISILILVSITIYVLLKQSFLLDRIALGFNDVARVQIWVSSFHAWVENNLFFGIGVGNSIFIDVEDYYKESALTSNIDNTHNVYLDMLLERGLLGLISFLTFMFSFFVFKDTNSDLLMFIRLLVFSLLLMGLANITFRYEFALLFMTLLGAILNPSIKK